MKFSKGRLGYFAAMLAFAFWFSLKYYQRGVSEASLMAETTSIFSNVVFVGVLLMGFMIFMLRKGRQVF